MNNNDIELALIQKFGIKKTVIFCELATVMYDMLYTDWCKNHPISKDHEPLPFDYTELDYERDCWKESYERLSEMGKTLEQLSKS